MKEDGPELFLFSFTVTLTDDISGEQADCTIVVSVASSFISESGRDGARKLTKACGEAVKSAFESRMEWFDKPVKEEMN
jgi:hypothetical protein